VGEWLAAAGFVVSDEVVVAGRRADLVGWRGDCVTAVEAKLSDWQGAFRQAVAYQVAADRTWVAMPLVAAARAHRHRWRFESEGVGLLAVDDAGRVRAAIPAGLSRRLLPFARDAVSRTSVGGTGLHPLPLSTKETSLEPF
jgi:hypothetical protein